MGEAALGGRSGAMAQTLTLELAEDASELAEALFHEAGCLGLEVRDASVKPMPGQRAPAAGHALFVGYVDDDAAEALRLELQEAFPGVAIEQAPVVEQDWSEKWKDLVQSVSTARLWVGPPWDVAKAAPEKVKIVIEPGMAFGTGEHATTATCLRLLCDAVGNFSEGWRAMDAGTGSGILGIAAEKLGASAIEAFDFDPVCVRIAKENAKHPGCRRITVTKADSRKISLFHRADVILANLFSELLLASAPGFARKLANGGWLIFSGVLRKQADEVSAGLVKLGFEPPRIVPRGKWCAGVTRLKK